MDVSSVMSQPHSDLPALLETFCTRLPVVRETSYLSVLFPHSYFLISHALRR